MIERFFRISLDKLLNEEMDEQLAESAAPNPDVARSFQSSLSPIKTDLPIALKHTEDENDDEDVTKISKDISESVNISKNATGSKLKDSIQSRKVLRDTLVQTAANFLKNPKTIKSSAADKRSFLLKKGLTQEEIDQAFFISGFNQDEFEGHLNENAAVDLRNGLNNLSYSNTNAVSRNDRSSNLSLLSMLSQFSFAISLLGGLAWGLYHMIRSYLVPLFQTSRQLEKRMKKQDNTLHQMSLTLEAINSQLALNASEVTNDSFNMSKRDEDLRSILEELKSMKKLMLSKENFPPPPKIEPIPQDWKVGHRRNLETNTTNGLPNGSAGYQNEVENSSRQVDDRNTACFEGEKQLASMENGVETSKAELVNGFHDKQNGLLESE